MSPRAFPETKPRISCEESRSKFSSKDRVSLPLDIQYEILLLVSVLDLIRLKLVCKTWMHLISSQSFAHDQLAHADKSSHPGILVSSWQGGHGLGSDYYNVANWLCGSEPARYHHRAVNLHSFLDAEEKDIEVASSCNGLLLVHNYKCWYMDRLLVCNPITRSNFKVAAPILLLGMYEQNSWLIGYDYAANKYKVAAIKRTAKSRCEAVVLAAVDGGPYDKHTLGFTDNHYRVHCSLAVKGKFIWLMFSKLAESFGYCLYYQPRLIWLDTTREEGVQEALLTLGNEMPMGQLEVSNEFKLYEANDGLRLIFPSNIDRGRIVVWETGDWERMSHWSWILVVQTGLELYNPITPICIMAIMALDITGQLHRGKSREKLAEDIMKLIEWITVQKRHGDRITTVLHSDSLVNL